MEDFVAKLIKKSDLSVLTTKAVRKAYESHIKKTLSPDAKSRLKVFVNGILDKLAMEMRASSPRKSPRKGPVINMSAKKVSEIVESALSPKKLSEDRITRSSPRKSSESRKARSQSPLESEAKTPRKSAKKIETHTGYDQDSDDEGDKSSRSKKTGKNVKAKNAGDSSSEHDKGSDPNGSDNSDESEDQESKSATPKSVSKTKSPGKMVQTKEVKESDDEQMEDLSENETNVSPAKRNTRHSVSPKKLKQQPSTRSPSKPTPRGKKRKSLNVNEALEVVMDSHKDEESENGDISPDSDSESEEELVVKKKKGQKRKLFTSDEDDGKKATPMKGRKKGTPRKPLPKKQKVSDDEKSSEESDSDVDEHISSKKTRKVQSNEESADESAQREVKKKISSSKKQLSRRHKVPSDVESDDSEDDRLHIDVGVSNRTRKGREILQGSNRRERRGGKVTNFAESDSEMESLSSKAESVSGKIESDGASVDSGVNVDLRASSEKGKKGKEAEEDVDESVKIYGKKSGKRKSSSGRNVKRKSYKESDDDSDDEDETITNDRSIFSLSETESDKNTKKRKLRKAFQQRHIAKLLENESFDVKQCTIVLERIDDQIDWVRKTSKFKVSSRKVSARDSNHLDFTESEDNSVSSKEDGRKRKQLSKLPKSSTPVAKNLQNEILKTIEMLETDDSNSDDASLASTRTKVKKQTRGLNSTFNSEDNPLKSLRKRGKGKDRSVDSDGDEPDSSLAKSSKSTRSANRRRALDSTFDSDDLPIKSVGKKGRGKTVETDEDEEDEQDSPLVKSGKSKSASRRRALDSTFESDDLPLKPVGKKGKGKGKYVYVDEEEEPFPSEDSDKPIFKSKAKNPMEPDVDYQAEQSGSNSENDSSDEIDIAGLPSRTSPRKLETSLDLAPSQATRSHSVSPSKSKKSDIISESESGSDVGSLNDSIRSLEMLRGAKEKSPKSSIKNPKRNKKLTKRRSNVPRGDNSDSDESRDETSPRKPAARRRHKSGSDSDVSSIIEAQDSSMVSAVNGNNNSSESETGSKGPTNQNGSVVERSSSRKESKDESSDSGDSDMESKPDESRKSKSVDVESDDTGLSVEAVKSPPKKGKKRGKKTAHKKSADVVESDDTGLSVEAVKKGKKKGKNTADKSSDSGDSDMESKPDESRKSKSVDEVESDDTGLSVEAVKSPPKKGKKRGKKTADKSSDSGDSDMESKPDESRKSKSVDVVESDDTGLSVEAVKSPLKKGKKRGKKTAEKKSADVVESDDTGLSVEAVKKGKKKGKNTADKSSDSGDSDMESKPDESRKSKSVDVVESDDTGLSVEAVKSPLKKGKKRGKKTAEKKSADVVESDDTGLSVEAVKKGKKKGKNTADKENGTVTLTKLRKICRCAGIILRNTIELVGCDTDEKKRSKICEILRQKGMKGQPTMSKAETLKLKKEASELDTDNIISDTGRPKRRKVQSRYRRGGDSRSPSPKKKLTPLKQKLSGLRGIIDSEGSESG